jgi:hypothetical protein
LAQKPRAWLLMACLARRGKIGIMNGGRTTGIRGKQGKKRMEKHHEQSIDNLVTLMEKDESLQALILGGSLVHGFAGSDSDIDVTMVVCGEEYRRRTRENALHYNNRELCPYEGGYIDGKYVDYDFLKLVAERGSDPARFAFRNNRILFSRLPGLEELLERIVRFPVEEKEERVERFAAQLLAWRWYYGEGLRRENAYLTALAAQKLILFGGRIVLTVNEMLYPFHKWLLRVLETAPRKPSGMMEAIDGLLKRPAREFVEDYCRTVLDFAGLDAEALNAVWPTWFIKDTETRWMTAAPGIDDL